MNTQSKILFSVFVLVQISFAQFENFDVNSETNLLKFSSIYERIQGDYENTYESIGKKLGSESVKNGLYGGVNLIGWQHANDYSAFKIQFHRSAAPFLFDDESYLVNDEFIIEINAADFLKQLADEEVIDITEDNLQAYAGISFKRKMRFNHFADDYASAMQTNFKKLFFMYQYFKTSGLAKLRPYDYLQKEDSFIFSAGAMGSAGLGNGAGIGAGIYSKYEKKSKITIQALGENDAREEDESIRITSENERTLEAGANISLLIDFYNLLKITLFKYDFSYSRSESYKVYLSLFEGDLENQDIANAVESTLQFAKFDYNALKDRLTATEKRKKEIKESKYLAFILGGVKKSKTQSSEILKDGKVHKFFTHNYERLKYRQNFLSKLMGMLFKGLLGYNQVTNNDEVRSNQVEINYESQEELINSKKDFDIFSDHIFTMTYENKVKFMKNSKVSKDRVHKSMKSVIKNQSDSYKDYRDLLDKYEFRAPANFNAKVVLDNDNIKNFINNDTNKVFKIFKKVCQSKSKNVFKRFLSLFTNCRYKLNRKYTSFLKEWSTANYSKDIIKKCTKKYRRRRGVKFRKRRLLINRCKELSSKTLFEKYKHSLPLWKFKDVAYEINNSVANNNGLRMIYGDFGVRGTLYSTLDGSIPYHSVFSYGEFKNNILDEFSLKEGLRAPASIE